MDTDHRPLVIFDLDGTLFETAATFGEAICLAALDTGLPQPDLTKAVGLLGHAAEDFCELLYPSLTENKHRSFRERLHVREHEAVARAGRLFTGVDHMLRELVERGFTLGVCSNGSREYIDLVLSTCKVAHWFAFIEGREDGRGKSDAMKQLVTNADLPRAIVVGDHRFDIEAAKDNSLPCIGVSYGYGGEDIEMADFVADTPEAVLGHVVRCDIYDRIARDISRIQSDKSTIVGINGIDTSGKTIFSEGLARYLRAIGCETQVVHLDDFHNQHSVRTAGDDEIAAYINNAFDLDRLVSELLRPVKQGNTVDKELTLLNLDRDTFSNQQHYHVGNDTLVIVEGTLLYRPPLNEYFDYRIFLDVSFDEVLRRAGRRDVPRFGSAILEKYERKYIPIQQWYLKKYNPVITSDLVIDNTDFLMPTVR